jgi:hypothetical protein
MDAAENNSKECIYDISCNFLNSEIYHTFQCIRRTPKIKPILKYKTKNQTN